MTVSWRREWGRRFEANVKWHLGESLSVSTDCPDRVRGFTAAGLCQHRETARRFTLTWRQCSEIWRKQQRAWARLCAHVYSWSCNIVFQSARSMWDCLVFWQTLNWLSPHLNENRKLPLRRRALCIIDKYYSLSDWVENSNRDDGWKKERTEAHQTRAAEVWDQPWREPIKV